MYNNTSNIFNLLEAACDAVKNGPIDRPQEYADSLQAFSYDSQIRTWPEKDPSKSLLALRCPCSVLEESENRQAFLGPRRLRGSLHVRVGMIL